MKKIKLKIVNESIYVKLVEEIRLNFKHGYKIHFIQLENLINSKTAIILINFFSRVHNNFFVFFFKIVIEASDWGNDTVSALAGYIVTAKTLYKKQLLQVLLLSLKFPNK